MAMTVSAFVRQPFELATMPYGFDNRQTRRKVNH